jgi:hypothetical protein
MSQWAFRQDASDADFCLYKILTIFPRHAIFIAKGGQPWNIVIFVKAAGPKLRRHML